MISRRAVGVDCPYSRDVGTHSKETDMIKRFNPFTPWTLGMQIAKIGIEAQAVIALRMAGMMGLWDTHPSEVHRMVAEKQRAAVASVGAASRAVMAGKSPEAVLSAGLKPIGRRTASNARRLARLGPKTGA